MFTWRMHRCFTRGAGYFRCAGAFAVAIVVLGITGELRKEKTPQSLGGRESQSMETTTADPRRHTSAENRLADLLRSRSNLAGIEWNPDAPDDSRRINLANMEGAVLPGARLYRADLRMINFRLANLCGAELFRARLDGCRLGLALLRETHLQGASLRGARAQAASFLKASLRGADLTRCDLRAAVLREAALSQCNLRSANLRGADVRGADLRGADLRGADLRGADLQRAVYDVHTRWPVGLDLTRRGAILSTLPLAQSANEWHGRGETERDGTSEM